MAGFGPAPKPQGQRRNRNKGLAASSRRLPAAGRQGNPPAWPLSKQSKREVELWLRIWKTPHAVAWEELEWGDTVARYVRQLTVAERRKPPVAVLAEVRQLEDRLGLSPMAMLRLRWEISDDAVAESEETDPRILDIRERIRAVEGE